MLWHFHAHDIFVKQQSDGEFVTFTLKSVSISMEQWVKTMSAVAVWCSTHYPRATCSKDRLALSIRSKFADDEIDPFIASLKSALEAYVQNQVHGTKVNCSGIDLAS